MAKDNIPKTDLGGGLFGGVLSVTPAMAKAWLEKNDPGNRSVSSNKVESLKNDMLSGNWRLTHQGICFDEKDNLTDGQHRLHAIAQSGVPVSLLVVGNPESKISDPIDRSIPRTLAFLTGKSTRVVAALNMLRMLEVGYYISAIQTTAEVQATYDHHRGALEALHSRVRLFSQMMGPVLGACAYAHPCHEERVTSFAQQVATGEMIKRGDPAYALRSWIENNPGVSTWDRTLATLNAVRYHVHELPLKGVFTGDSGYRAITSRRRSLKVPYTPGTSLVMGSNWTPTSRDKSSQD